MKEKYPVVTVRSEPIKLSDGGTVLVVTCTGEYGVGSRGKPDANAILTEIERGLSLTKADSVLLDYSGLSYEWGDDIGATFYLDELAEGDKLMPVAVIVGDGCQEAIRSLLESDLGYDSWLDSGFIFFNRESAESYLNLKIRNAQQGAPVDAAKPRD